MANTTCKVTWVESFLSELGVAFQNPQSITSDGSASVSISKKIILHVHMKHVEIDQHIVRDKVTAGILNVIKVLTTYIITKSLPKDLFLDLRGHLPLCDILGPGPECSLENHSRSKGAC